MITPFLLCRYQIRGAHVHVDVFVNGANAGRLIFRIEEFDDIQRKNVEKKFGIEFLNNNPKSQKP